MIKLSVVASVLRKEFKELIRDRRAVIVGIVVPIFLFPAILSFINNINEGSKKKLLNSLSISVRDRSNPLVEFLENRVRLTILESPSPRKEVRSGRAHLALIIPANLTETLAEERLIRVELYIDNTNQHSIEAEQLLRSHLKKYSTRIVQTRLKRRGVDTELLTPLMVSTKADFPPAEGKGMLMLSILLPLLLLIYSAVSPLAVSADLGAGEKERSTLESLLSTQAGRLEILIGKFLSITVFGLIGVVSFLIGFFIAFLIYPDFFGGDGLFQHIHLISFLLISYFTVLLTMIFGAIELSVSLFARTIKEAQIYAVPIMLIGMTVGYGTIPIDVKTLSLFQLSIPLLNISILIKELVVGYVNITHLIIINGWAFVYIGIALWISSVLFSRENVIFRS